MPSTTSGETSDDPDLTGLPAWARVWHIWRIVIPRRSVDSGLVWGNVWRRHDGRRWIYKRLTGFDEG